MLAACSLATAGHQKSVTGVDPLQFLDRIATSAGHIVSPLPGRYLVLHTSWTKQPANTLHNIVWLLKTTLRLSKYFGRNTVNTLSINTSARTSETYLDVLPPIFPLQPARTRLKLWCTRLQCICTTNTPGLIICTCNIVTLSSKHS